MSFSFSETDIIPAIQLPAMGSEKHTESAESDGKNDGKSHTEATDSSDSIYACPKCKDTFFVYEGDDDTCPKCKVKLVPTCEWCNLPEKECTCGKENIQDEEEVEEHEY